MTTPLSQTYPQYSFLFYNDALSSEFPVKVKMSTPNNLTGICTFKPIIIDQFPQID